MVWRLLCPCFFAFQGLSEASQAVQVLLDAGSRQLATMQGSGEHMESGMTHHGPKCPFASLDHVACGAHPQLPSLP